MLANRLPRSWALALEQVKRDARVVTRRVAGYGAPPLVKGFGRSERPVTVGTVGTVGTATTASAHASPGGARVSARAMLVERVVLETADAVTLVMRPEDGAPISFRAGQFFTVLTDHDGEEVPRNYSASNHEGQGELHLTIKKKEGGRISETLCRTQPGDRLRVLGPFGSFVVEDGGDSSPRRLVLIAGGAGITPLASIARTVLAVERSAEVALVYANRRAADVIFSSALEELEREHAGRFTLVHVLEDGLGKLTRENTTRTLDTLPLASHPAARFYVCGPDGMRDEVLAALAARGVGESAIRIERFATGPRPQVSTSSASIAASVAPGARPIAIRIKDRTHRTMALPGATVLEAGLAAGAAMPYSCAVGGCGACRVKLIEGNIELEEPNCLTSAERAAGYVLACIGRPSGPCTVEVPEES